MKKLLCIVGSNAVGKTTTAHKIVEQYGHTAFVDSDWCRVMNPFGLTETSRWVITENLYCMLRNYLSCKDVDTVVFTHSWHGGRKQIFDDVIKKLHQDQLDFQEQIVILRCSAAENMERAAKDGRDEERIRRGMEKSVSIYDHMDYPSIDTTCLTPAEAAQKVFGLINH